MMPGVTKLLKEMDDKIESNMKGQNENFETKRANMKLTPNFESQLYTSVLFWNNLEVLIFILSILDFISSC